MQILLYSPAKVHHDFIALLLFTLANKGALQGCVLCHLALEAVISTVRKPFTSCSSYTSCFFRTGDEYVCTDIAALLPRIVYEPADYDSGKRKTLDHPSTRLDVADFVTESFHSDVRLASLW